MYVIIVMTLALALIQTEYCNNIHLLVEWTLFTIRHCQVRPSCREHWKQGSWWQGWYFRQSFSSYCVDHRQVRPAVNDDSREIEQTILHRPTKYKRCEIKSVRTECNVMSSLIVCSRHAITCSDHMTFNKIIQTNNVTSISTLVISKSDSTITKTRIKCNEQSNSRTIE